MSVRGRLPYVLVGSGLALLGLVAALLLVRHGGGRPKAVSTPSTATAPAPATTTAPPTTATAPPTTTATPPPPPAAISDVSVETAPSSARISWIAATPVHVAYGPSGQAPTLWAKPIGNSVTLGGLSVGGSYDVHLTTKGGAADVTVHTTAPSSSVSSSTGGGDVLLEGQPFFPLIVYGQCPGAVDGVLSLGINLLTNNGCGGTAELAAAVSGRALTLAQPSDGAVTGPVIGTNYPDEPDGHGITGATLPPVSSLRFLTLTNHFYSGAAPLPQGRGAYPGLISKADVIGFDLYPLQNWCRQDALPAVYEAQRELVRLAAGKPTFQWIETGHMDCPDTPELHVSPEVLRAESWLAVAGGARGLGFFPIGWTGEIGEAIRNVALDVQALGPALLAADAPASADGPVKVGARRLGGALYVFAVNPTYAPASATIRIPQLGGRTLQVLGEGRTVTAQADGFTDSFGPLAVHLYVAAP